MCVRCAYVFVRFACVCVLCLYLATVAGVALGAGAAEGFQGVLAEAAVEAGLGVALVHLVLTMGAREAVATRAGVAVDLVGARPSVEAGAGGKQTAPRFNTWSRTSDLNLGDMTLCISIAMFLCCLYRFVFKKNE